MGLCVSKQPRWIEDPVNFDGMVLAKPVKPTRAEKKADKIAAKQWADEMRAKGVKVGKVKTERFAFHCDHD